MLRIVPHTVPRVGRSYEHFLDGFELHLLRDKEPIRSTHVLSLSTGAPRVLHVCVCMRVRGGTLPTPPARAYLAHKKQRPPRTLQ